MPKDKHNYERWLRNNAEIYTRMGSPQIAEKMVLCADEIHRLRMADDLHEQGAELMRDEAQALRNTVAKLEAEAVALREMGHELAALKEEVKRLIRALDALAALVGDE